MRKAATYIVFIVGTLMAAKLCFDLSFALVYGRDIAGCPSGNASFWLPVFNSGEMQAYEDDAVIITVKFTTDRKAIERDGGLKVTDKATGETRYLDPGLLKTGDMNCISPK